MEPVCSGRAVIGAKRKDSVYCKELLNDLWPSHNVGLRNINIHFRGTVFWLLQAVSMFQHHQQVFILDGRVGESP